MLRRRYLTSSTSAPSGMPQTLMNWKRMGKPCQLLDKVSRDDRFEAFDFLFTRTEAPYLCEWNQKLTDYFCWSYGNCAFAVLVIYLMLRERLTIFSRESLSIATSVCTTMKTLTCSSTGLAHLTSSIKPGLLSVFFFVVTSTLWCCHTKS